MIVHPRINIRHPEISDADVAHAWNNYTFAVTHDVTERELRTGFDLQGRELEMIGALSGGEWLVFHAFTPPTKKFKAEISAISGRI